MAEQPKYLLGNGELLASEIAAPKKPQEKKHPYTYAEARERLAPRLSLAARSIARLPAAACPNDRSVAAVVLHPKYIAKSFFPERLFSAIGLESVGSKPVLLKPTRGATTKKVEGKAVEVESPSTQLFVAGRRRAFARWAEALESAEPAQLQLAEIFHDELIRFEDVRFITPEERLKPLTSKNDNPLMEVVLHSADDEVLEGFETYLATFDVRVDLGRRIEVQNLCFIPVRIPKDVQRRVAEYSFLRVAREMPGLRELRPVSVPKITRSMSFDVDLPDEPPLNTELRVAVFDGGVPKGMLRPWIRQRPIPGLTAPVTEYLEHGVAVSSALLFGTLRKGEPAPTPLTYVDHYRILDEDTDSDPQEELFPILERIRSVLQQSSYDFVNLSIGPELPIEDDEVHVWTAVLDELFADGQSLVTVAVGNSGHRDRSAGLARVQVPADAVNMIAVGAADSSGDDWKRANYSCIGPGRSPGVVKPDVLGFGGSAKSGFWVVDAGDQTRSAVTRGTSFAAPVVLRSGIALRALLGPAVKPIALKALLIHHSEAGDHDPLEVGWGRIPTSLDQIILCPDGTTHVLYQGQLSAGKYLRAVVPLPKDPLDGFVTLKATFCYACETDPQDPFSYTRSGLDITFRPNEAVFGFNKKLGKFSKEPKTKPFFSRKAYSPELDLRQNAHWWEPVLKQEKRFRADKLAMPVFDIHHNARQGGGGAKDAKPIPYALVLTITAPNEPKLYDRIVQRYATILRPLQPVLKLPIQFTV
jgi:hypothetical protein